MKFNYCCVCGAWKKIVGMFRCQKCYDKYYGSGK